MAIMNLGAAALNQTPLDWENNLQNIKSAVQLARNNKVRLLCLPELSITGYGCQDMFLSPWLTDKAASILELLIPLSKDIYFTVGLPVRVDGQLYNGIAILGEGELQGITLKQNLPDDGIYYEPRWFNPWKGGEIRQLNIAGQSVNVGDVIYHIDGVKVGIEVCEDAWRVQRPAASFCVQGVDIVLNPSASHFEFGKSEVRKNLMRSSSKKFDCVYVYANLLGNESGRIIYEGDLIIAQRGRVLNSSTVLNAGLVNLISQEIDTGFSPSEEPEHEKLDKNQEFLLATGLGLFDYLRKSHSRCFVLSLSGGADSATCAVLVSQMVKRMSDELGEHNFLKLIHRQDLVGKSHKEIMSELLICVYQSTINSSETTFNAAKGLAAEVGATFYNWSVQEELDTSLQKIENAIGRTLSWENDDIALQNIQARMRSPFVWSLANIFNGLLLTTSNRSEGDVGYATMDGDTSGSLAPIAGVDKVFVRDWLLWAEKELKLSSLQAVNKQNPTAELRPGSYQQTDEDDLMPYPVLLKIERLFLKEKFPPKRISEALCADLKVSEKQANTFVDRFFRLWTRNQWKRERLAPSFHLDDFNIDPKTWMRFPILSGSLNSSE